MQSSVLVVMVVAAAAVVASATGPLPIGTPIIDHEHILKVSASASSEQWVATSLAHVSLSISIERKAVQLAADDSSEQGGSDGADGDRPLTLEQGLVQAAIEANAELARRANHLIGLVQAAGVEKLRTTSARLDQVYEYPQNEPPRQIGVRVHEGLSFRINLTLVGEVLTSIIGAGATRIDGISFVAADEEIERVTLIAIRQAVQKAKLRAMIGLQEAGCLGIIGVHAVSLSTPDGGHPQPLLLETRALFAKSIGSPAPAALPVIGGENSINVQASVTLHCRPLPAPRCTPYN